MHVVLVRFGEDEDIVTDLVRLEEGMIVGKEEPLACVPRVVSGMLNADGAGFFLEVGGGTC